jgi:hypothetical protein
LHRSASQFAGRFLHARSFEGAEPDPRASPLSSIVNITYR